MTVSAAAEHRSCTEARRRSRLAPIQAVSLDVVAGVVCAGAFAASASGATMPPAWWVALPAATWVVYSLDHVLDVPPGRPIESARRRFHRRSRSRLLVHACLVGTIALVAAALLPRQLLFGGVVLGAASAAHLVLAQATGDRFPKELTAAVVYTLAIWYGPLDVGGHVDGWVLLLAGAHGCAALGNLVMFTVCERAADAADGQASMAHGWGVARLRRWLALVTVAGGAAVVAVGVAGPSRLSLHAAALGVVLVTPAVLAVAHERSGRDVAYRTWGDLAFLLLLLPAVVA